MNSESLAHIGVEGVGGLLVAGVEWTKVDGVLILMGPIPAKRWCASDVVEDSPPVVHEVLGFAGIVGLHHESKVGIGTFGPHGVARSQKGLDVSKHPIAMVGSLYLPVGLL